MNVITHEPPATVAKLLAASAAIGEAADLAEAVGNADRAAVLARVKTEITNIAHADYNRWVAATGGEFHPDDVAVAA